MRFLLPTLLLLVVLVNCRKADRNEDTDTSMGEDFGAIENAVAEVFFATHEACLSTTGIRSYTSCATITADTLGTPRELVIDFGTGCISPSGRTRMGKIVIYQNGYYTTTGSTSKIYFDAFYCNGYNFGGNLKLTTTGTGYQVVATDFKITAPDSSYFIVLNGMQVLVQTAGSSTNAADDDTFSATGSFSMTGRKGGFTNCTITTGNPLVFSGTCAQVVQGEVDLQPNGLVNRPMDFGAGSCDNSFTLNINGEIQTLSINF